MSFNQHLSAVSGLMRFLHKFGITIFFAVVALISLTKTVKAKNIITSYQDQQAWRDIEQYLPPEFHIAPDQLPQEEWMPWHRHQLHLDTYRNPQAKIKVILFHGVGTNGRQMTMILGKPLADRGYETIAVDLPGYGLTQIAKDRQIRYEDWVQAGSDLIDQELQRDTRPIVLYGLSAGGMLSYHIAAKNRKVKAISGMTFLDTRNSNVRDIVARNLFISRVGTPVTHLAAKTPLASMRIPMRLASKMNTLVNNKQALKVFLKDKSSAGNSVSLSFLDSYLHYKPELEATDFNVCPILLTQPEQDRWTPLSLSTPFLNRIQHVPVTTVILQNAGHYPLEQPGLAQMVDAIDSFYRSSVNSAEK